MATRAGKLLTGESPGIERLARDCKASWQKPLLLLRPEFRVSQQILVLGNPEHFFRREMFPAVGAGHPIQQSTAST
jgi:hypothetical protein